MLRRTTRFLIAMLVAAVSASCASGYKQFYQPNPNIPPERVAALRAAPPTGKPIVERSRPEPPERILDAYAKRGYVLIGSSSFNSGSSESDSAAIEQGVAVGADLVLILNPTYTGTVTSAIPITTPTTSTSVSSATATAYGRSGAVTAYGTGTTTTYGSQTTFIPFTVHRADYAAAYFVKQRFGLGAFFRDLDDSERQRLQTNRGAVARLIVDNTPAFDADILVGDIFVSIDGIAISNQQALGAMLAERRGKKVRISIVRNGTPMEKTVTLNP